MIAALPLGLFGWVKRLPRWIGRGAKATGKGTVKVLNHPAIDMGISVATLFLPGAQAVKFLLVLKKVRELERALGTGTGPQKFLAVWQALRDEPWVTSDKELKGLIEHAVMVIHGRLQVRDERGTPVAPAAPAWKDYSTTTT